jgi:hypothetical protein
MGGPDRIPGQRPADPPATPCAVPTASPRLPLRAAPPTPEPGGPLLDPRLGLRHANIPGPPCEVPPKVPEDLAQRPPTGPGGEPAPRRLARPPGRLAHPASVRPMPRARATEKRPPPRAVYCPFGGIDPQLQPTFHAPRHPGQHALPRLYAPHVDVAIICVTDAPVAPTRPRLIQTVPP